MGNNPHLKRFPCVGLIACDFQSHRANAKVGYLSRVNQNAAFSKKKKEDLSTKKEKISKRVENPKGRLHDSRSWGPCQNVSK